MDPGDDLEPRIRARVDRMAEEGLVGEVMGLSGRMSRTARAAVGYREILQCIEAGEPAEDGLAAIPEATRRLAMRQRTWFQRDPRIDWIPWSDRASTRLDAVMERIG